MARQAKNQQGVVSRVVECAKPAALIKRRYRFPALAAIDGTEHYPAFAGDLLIESAGETGDSVFENIPDPERVRTVIFAQMEADEQADSHRDAAAIREAESAVALLRPVPYHAHQPEQTPLPRPVLLPRPGHLS